MSDSVFQQPSRRAFITIGGLAIGGLAFAACAPKASTGSTGATGGTEAKLGVGNNGQVGKGRAGATADSLLIAGFQWGNPTTFNVFSPTAAEVEKAKRIIAALKEAEAQGKGAASLEGKMIDAASEKMATNILVVADKIAASAAK